MEIPRAQRNPARPGLARIVSVVCKLTQTTEEALHRQQRRGARLIVTWLGRHFHYSHRETGEVLGVGRAAAGRLEAVTDSQMEKDKSLRTFVTRCLSELK